ncbi:hypothetical protein [Virgibacillus alimentarius]|uniref:Gas vesicle protein n=1 Tax=Virgibacillus alimentarius TaxID=698769 RepID=A0ABS4SAY8_9BACI|nr:MULTISPECIES: hypothetical protein [Virgibacillus]MBP2258512.1 gas vesicle protein [Virgibacillus alimentarius]HLR67492.1 YtxH domain-containing protein [Virgibacillus sp.]
MGKRNLCLGMIIGAIVGGIATLINKDTRAYTKDKIASYKSKTTYFVKNPSEGVRKTKVAFNQLNDRINYNAENMVNALEQVENTLDKLSSKKDQE